MFALTHITDFEFINLKAKPNDVVRLCEEYDGSITPGYHMNKRHWVSVAMTEALDDEFVEQLIEDSYNLVVASLPKQVQADL